MRNFFVFIFLIYINQIGNGQDLVVHESGDSLNCEVIIQDSLKIYIRIIRNRKLTQTFINRSEVSSIIPDYYQVPIKKSHTPVKINLNAGSGYLTGESGDGLSTQQAEYLKEIRSGFTFDTDLLIFPSKSVGFGMKVDYFNTSNSNQNYEDHASITFVGGTFLTQSVFPEGKGHIFFSTSIGYMHLSNDARAFGNSINIFGTTIGAKIQSGLDIMLSNSVGIGFDIGFTRAVIKRLKSKMNYRYNYYGDSNDISRLDLMGGLKFYFQ